MSYSRTYLGARMYHIFIIISALIALPSINYAQKFISNTDKFSGNTIQYTKPETIYRKLGAGTAGEKVDFSIVKINDELLLNLKIRSGAMRIFKVSKGQTATLLTSNNERILLNSSSDEISEPIQGLTLGVTISCFYKLENANIDQLRKDGLQAIKIEHNAGSLEYDLKGKASVQIKKVLNDK